jgi:hypothetical protein
LVRGEASANARRRRHAAQLGTRGGGRPWSSAGRPVMTQNSGPTGSSSRRSIQRCRVLPGPLVHADLAAAPALAAAHEQRAATVVEVGLVERERLVDSHARSPQHDDQGAQPAAVAPVTGRAHDRDHLLDGRRIGRIALSFVTWRAAGVKARHRRRRPPTTGGVEQQLRHNSSSGSETSREHRGRVTAQDIALDAQRECRFASKRQRCAPVPGDRVAWIRAVSASLVPYINAAADGLWSRTHGRSLLVRSGLSGAATETVPPGARDTGRQSSVAGRLSH